MPSTPESAKMEVPFFSIKGLRVAFATASEESLDVLALAEEHDLLDETEQHVAAHRQHQRDARLEDRDRHHEHQQHGRQSRPGEP